MRDLLLKLKACKEALEWAGDKTWEEVYSTCERGDWLLWLFEKTNPDDLQLLTLAKAHCANTVRHLIRDKRLLNALDTAIAFGEGKATREELDYNASLFFNIKCEISASAAIYATTATSCAATVAVYSAEAFAYNFYNNVIDGSFTPLDDVNSSKEKNRKQTADICRKYLAIEVWNINRNET